MADGLPPIDSFKNEEMMATISDEEVLKVLHKLLLEVEIIEGELICPETGRKFPIVNGIPNMLVGEDETAWKTTTLYIFFFYIDQIKNKLKKKTLQVLSFSNWDHCGLERR